MIVPRGQASARYNSPSGTPMTTPPTIEPRVPERLGLEISFVRARWLGALALAVLWPIGALGAPATIALVALFAVGNAIVWRTAPRVQTLTGQRQLGVAAVTLDAVVVLSAGFAAEPGAAATTLGALVIVVAEASVRFAPVKAMITTGVLIGSLAAVMGLRDALSDDPFSVPEFALIALLSLLAGTMIGSAVREVYRHRVTPAKTEIGEEPLVPQEVEDQLTPRERQVLGLIVRGYSNAGIAAALVIEPKTVKNHINRIYGKLELNNRYEAITAVLGQRRDQT
jgi:DNA-binding NarL/FixJ family response regulator